MGQQGSSNLSARSMNRLRLFPKTLTSRRPERNYRYETFWLGTLAYCFELTVQPLWRHCIWLDRLHRKFMISSLEGTSRNRRDCTSWQRSWPNGKMNNFSTVFLVLFRVKVYAGTFRGSLPVAIEGNEILSGSFLLSAGFGSESCRSKGKFPC